MELDVGFLFICIGIGSFSAKLMIRGLRQEGINCEEKKIDSASSRDPDGESA